MKGNLIKIITLIVLIILVVVTFDLTNKNRETGLINNNEGNKTSSNISIKDEEKDNKETIIDDKQNEEKEEDNEIVQEEESNIIKQYKIFNSYIATPEKNEPKEKGYRYYIIRHSEELEKYMNEYLTQFDKENNKYKTYNEEKKEQILKEFNKEFFSKKSIVLLSVFDAKNPMNGNITQISKEDDGLVDLKIKKENNENLANCITYIIPVEKTTKSIKAKHIN